MATVQQESLLATTHSLSLTCSTIGDIEQQPNLLLDNLQPSMQPGHFDSLQEQLRAVLRPIRHLQAGGKQLQGVCLDYGP